MIEEPLTDEQAWLLAQWDLEGLKEYTIPPPRLVANQLPGRLAEALMKATWDHRQGWRVSHHESELQMRGLVGMRSQFLTAFGTKIRSELMED